MSNKKSSIQIRTEDAIRKQKEESRKLRIEALVWLAKEFPNAFNTNERINPLKLGIREDILAYAEKNQPVDRQGKLISRSKLREAVAMFTHRLDYLTCVKAAKSPRIDLEGNSVGDVTAKEAESAADIIKKRIEKVIRKSRKTMIQTVTPVPQSRPQYQNQNNSSRYPNNNSNNNYQRSNNFNNNYDNRSGQSHHSHYNNNYNNHHHHHGNNQYSNDRNQDRYAGQYRDNQRDGNKMAMDDHSMMTHHQINRSQNNVQVRHRSGSKQYDPKAVARLKEKLRISRNVNEEPIE